MCQEPCLTPNSPLKCIVPILQGCRLSLKHFAPNHPFPGQALGKDSRPPRVSGLLSHRGRLGQTWKLLEPWASLLTHNPTRDRPGTHGCALPPLGILREPAQPGGGGVLSALWPEMAGDASCLVWAAPASCYSSLSRELQHTRKPPCALLCKAQL